MILPILDRPDIGFDTLQLEKKIDGEINLLSNRKSSYYKNERCYRIIIPLNQNVRLLGDFTGWNYSVDGKKAFESLVRLKISDKDYQFFSFKSSKGGNYFIIDALNKQSLESFKKAIYSISLVYAFLKGNYHGDKAYILTYAQGKFKKPVSILSIVLGKSIYNGFPIHTTNPHSLIQIQNKLRYKKDINGKIVGTKDKMLKKYMKEFPSESYSNLCNLIFNNGGILRAVSFIVYNHKAILELKVPTLYVALENLTKVLTGADKSMPTLIEDKKTVAKIKKIIESTVKEITVIEKSNKPPLLNQADEKEYNANFSRLKNKLFDFNKGSNNKKLVEPFKTLGYILTKEEEKLILISRNKFLHGDDYMVINNEDFDLEFKELFHISLRLQKLLAVLLLKESRFSGYILNNAKIYDYITEKRLKEDVFIKI